MNEHKNPTFDLTPLMNAYFDQLVNDYLSMEGHDVEDLEYDNKATDRHSIRKIHSEALKSHPYDYKAVTALVTGAGNTKIWELCDKK